MFYIGWAGHSGKARVKLPLGMTNTAMVIVIWKVPRCMRVYVRIIMGSLTVSSAETGLLSGVLGAQFSRFTL